MSPFSKLFLLLLVTGCAHAQVFTNRAITAGLFNRPATLLVDNLTTAPVSAYSLRKLRSGYTGAAIRVRRSSDNTEADIGFTSAGVLDQTALLAFVGSNSGYVKTWYDQKGTMNFSQTSTGNQPRIVNAGSVILSNGVPTVEAVASNAQYMDGAYTNTGTTVYLSGVFTMRSSTAQYGRLFSFGAAGQNDYSSTSYFIGLVRNNGSSNYNANRVSDFGGNGTYNTLTTMSTSFDGTTGRFFLNGTQQSTLSTSGTFNISLFRLFGHVANTNDMWDGYCSEFILFSSYPATADQTAIQTSQKAFYGTP